MLVFLCAKVNILGTALVVVVVTFLLSDTNPELEKQSSQVITGELIASLGRSCHFSILASINRNFARAVAVLLNCCRFISFMYFFFMYSTYLKPVNLGLLRPHRHRVCAALPPCGGERKSTRTLTLKHALCVYLHIFCKFNIFIHKTPAS